MKTLFSFEMIAASANANIQNNKSFGSVAGIQNNIHNLNVNKGYGVNSMRDCDVKKATEETVTALQMLGNSVRYLTSGSFAELQQSSTPTEGGIARNSAPVLECLDMILKYVTYVLYKTSNTRILNQLTEFLDILAEYLEKANYHLNDVEIAILFPVLLDKVGHSKDHLREFLNGFLRRVLNLNLEVETGNPGFSLPGLKLTRVATLMLVRGLSATANQKSKMDVLIHLEEVLLRSAVSDDLDDPEQAGSSSSSSSSSSAFFLKTRKSKRVAMIIAKSKRDTSLIASQMESSIPEIRKQCLKVFEALYLALDHDTFSRQVRHNHIFQSESAQEEVDRVLKICDAAMQTHHRNYVDTVNSKHGGAGSYTSASAAGKAAGVGQLERYVRDAYSHMFAQDIELANIMREEAAMAQQLGLSPRLGDAPRDRDGLARIEEGENENEGTP